MPHRCPGVSRDRTGILSGEVGISAIVATFAFVIPSSFEADGSLLLQLHLRDKLREKEMHAFPSVEERRSRVGGLHEAEK